MRTVIRPAWLSVVSSVFRRYAEVLTVPGARAFFLAAAPARIGVAMIGFGLLWLVRWGTGSYAAAGLVTGAFTVTAALCAPVFGWLVDRFGQARVLRFTALLHATAIGLLGAAVLTHRPLWSVVLLGVVVGAALPQVASLTATRWSVLLAGSTRQPTAFALEALSNELSFLFGPALVGTVSVVAPPAGAGLAGVLVLVGSLALAGQHRSEPAVAHQHRATRRTGSFGGRGFVVIAVVNFGIGTFFGAMQVSVTAFVTEHGAAGSAGLVYSMLSITSVLAGFGYGARKWRASAGRQLVVALGVLTACAVPMLLVHTPVTLALAVLLPGVGLAPAMILVSLLAERMVDRAALARAFTVLTGVAAVGTALAAAVTGWLVDRSGAGWGFGVAVAAVALAAVVSALGAATG